jgi:transketolase
VDGHDVEQLAAPARAGPDGRPLVVLARTDPCRGMPPLRARAPRLHYVRFSDDRERRAFGELLDEL